MALSDGMVFIVLSAIGLYLTLYKHKIRLWRLVGCAGLVAVGLSAVMVEDTVPAFVFAGICIIVAGVQMFQDVASLTSG